jgi:hypothetical protein
MLEISSPSNIERDLTEDEKKESIDARHIRVRGDVMKEIMETEQRCIKDKLPFCRRCAIIDFENRIRELRMEQSLDAMNMNYAEAGFKKGFTADYIGDVMFILEAEVIKKERVLVGTSTMTQTVGIDQMFRCRKRNCRVSVFVPVNEKTSDGRLVTINGIEPAAKKSR